MQYLSLGFYSWRNSRNGSCFIQALCKIFNEHAHNRDVLSMLTLVNRQVALNYESKSKDQNQNMKKQIPHVCHTLMRDVYLHPTYRSTLV
ncbi:unnamed protein product [Orchesella dallaii]|uniref:Caspase family p10 domain-containing protein n=1 Tax=Orchesella dallaii TaxID=48710 RepID=A0ABP1QB63_9HEXA